MKAIKIALAIGLSATAFAQTGTRIMNGSASLNMVGFNYETRLEPPSPPLASTLNGGVFAGSGLHRFMTDSAQRKYFGYDIAVDAQPQADTYVVTIRPLSIAAEKIIKKDPASWTMLPLPGYPAPQTVHGGDTIALDLFTNSTTG